VKNKVLPEFASNSSNSSNSSSSSSCPTTTAVELRERLNAVKKAYKTARMKVIYENYDDVRQQWSKEVFQNRVCRRHTFIHNFWGYVEEMILFLVEKKKRNVERNENAREGTTTRTLSKGTKHRQQKNQANLSKQDLFHATSVAAAVARCLPLYVVP
jgi:hypothetical protein